jgi:hypothetical protein
MYKELCLQNNNYSINILKKNIYFISLIEIIQTQYLTNDFVINYILNKDYQLTEEENTISVDMVLFWQKHLKQSDLLDINLKKRTDSFSFEDFIKE